MCSSTSYVILASKDTKNVGVIKEDRDIIYA